jgi:hypothetical protein
MPGGLSLLIDNNNFPYKLAKIQTANAFPSLFG